MKNMWEATVALLHSPLIQFLIVVGVIVWICSKITVRVRRAKVVVEYFVSYRDVAVATAVLKEALTYAPKTWIEVKEIRSSGWIRVLVMESPDAQKFIDSVQALSAANEYRRTAE